MRNIHGHGTTTSTSLFVVVSVVVVCRMLHVVVAVPGRWSLYSVREISHINCSLVGSFSSKVRAVLLLPNSLSANIRRKHYRTKTEYSSKDVVAGYN